VYNLGIKFGLKLDPSFSDIWSSTMFVYDGWACSIEMDTFNGEVLSLMSNVELVILRLAWFYTKYPLIRSIEACLWHLARLFYMVIIVLVEYIYIHIYRYTFYFLGYFKSFCLISTVSLLLGTIFTLYLG